MAQQATVGSHKTTISTEDGVTRVVYHATPVVSFSRDIVTLDSGGYRTATTKTRMNQAAAQFGLGFTVYQKDFAWFVVRGLDWDNPVPFIDGMQFGRES